MRKFRVVALSSIMAAGIAIGGVSYAMASTDDGESDRKAGPLTPEVVAEMKAHDQPLPVANPETGETSGGAVRQSELDRRSDRVDEILAGIGIAGDDAQWDEAARAAMVVEAVPVTNEQGETIGYLGTRFIPAEKIEGERRSAQATLDQLARK